MGCRFFSGRAGRVRAKLWGWGALRGVGLDEEVEIALCWLMEAGDSSNVMLVGVVCVRGGTKLFCGREEYCFAGEVQWGPREVVYCVSGKLGTISLGGRVERRCAGGVNGGQRVRSRSV